MEEVQRRFFAVCALLMGGYLLVLGAVDLLDYARASRAGVKTVGQVEAGGRNGDRRGGLWFHRTVRFRRADGRVATFQAQRPFQILLAPKVGEEVPVLYLPDGSGRAVVDTAAQAILGPILSALLGWFLLGFAGEEVKELMGVRRE